MHPIPLFTEILVVLPPVAIYQPDLDPCAVNHGIVGLKMFKTNYCRLDKNHCLLSMVKCRTFVLVYCDNASSKAHLRV